jgi:hypothetical protein
VRDERGRTADACGEGGGGGDGYSKAEGDWHPPERDPPPRDLLNLSLPAREAPAMYNIHAYVCITYTYVI